MKAVIVNSCDAWKTYASFRLIGVFTNRRKLNKCLNDLDKDSSIRNTTDYAISEMEVHDLNINLDYVSIEEINLNEVQ